MVADSDPDDDRSVDEALEETFPASDAPANTGETGVKIGEAAAAPDLPVIDNTAASRFEVTVDGAIAFLQYERRGRSIALIHTEVPKELRGHHVGEHLVKGALDAARAEGLQIVAICPFVRRYLKQHPL